MAHPYMQEGLLCHQSQSQDHRGDTRRPAITRGELDRAVEGHHTSSRTGICSFVREGTAGALLEAYEMTSSKLQVCMFLTKLHEGSTSSSGTCAAWMVFTWEHHNCQVRDWHPPFSPQIEQVNSEHRHEIKSNQINFIHIDHNHIASMGFIICTVNYILCPWTLNSRNLLTGGKKGDGSNLRKSHKGGIPLPVTGYKLHQQNNIILHVTPSSMTGLAEG